MQKNISKIVRYAKESEKARRRTATMVEAPPCATLAPRVDKAETAASTALSPFRRLLEKPSAMCAE